MAAGDYGFWYVPPLLQLLFAVTLPPALRGSSTLDLRGYSSAFSSRSHSLARLRSLTPGLFLDAFILNTIPSSDPTSLPSGYLAQAPLLDRPSLQSAAPALEHYKGPKGDVYGRTLWVGPRGSFTPFHRDPNVGLYTQIVGRKVFHLVPPEAERVLRPGKGVHANTSAVPVSVRRVLQEKEGEEEEGEGQPLTKGEEADSRAVLAEALAMPGACVAQLGPGDSVLIPQGWWHSAEGESVGVGVNAWFR